MVRTAGGRGTCKLHTRSPTIPIHSCCSSDGRYRSNLHLKAGNKAFPTERSALYRSACIWNTPSSSLRSVMEEVMGDLMYESRCTNLRTSSNMYGTAWSAHRPDLESIAVRTPPFSAPTIEDSTPVSAPVRAACVGCWESVTASLSAARTNTRASRNASMTPCAVRARTRY
jgi:hypothetical protein